jgi:glycine cleavage system pyridoxal-binding protein P
MLAEIGADSLDDLITQTVPQGIRTDRVLALGPAFSETAALAELSDLARQNQTFTSMIGLGYYDTITPPVILRNVLENPAWYTAYTPYQAEISQGRLEMLLNFQTMVSDLTGLEIANASLLDEGTAAAEAMTMCRRLGPADRSVFWSTKTAIRKPSQWFRLGQSRSEWRSRSENRRTSISGRRSERSWHIPVRAGRSWITGRPSHRLTRAGP